MPRGRAGIAALGAAALALSLPRLGLWPLGWIGLVPLLVALNAAARRREAAWIGLAAGFAYHGVVLHWIYATCRFAGVPAPVGALAWAALAAFLALNWALAAALGRELTRRASRGVRPWLWAVVWTAVASASERWTPRLAVDLLAYTQGPNLALLQAGSWGGPHLVGFLVLLVNAALAEAWPDADPRDPGPAAAPLAAALALTAGVWAHGAWVLASRPAPSGPAARVEILQPCVDQYHKWDRAYVQEILAGFDELLARPRPSAPALVVWPETSIPRWTGRDEAAPEAARWAKALGAAQLVGVVAGEMDDAANAVQLVDPAGGLAGSYAKRELVPFGEYVPLRRLVPRFVIDRWLGILDDLGDMTPGPAAPEFLPTVWGSAAVTICYEAMFPRWSRRDAARGARLLVNVTNDGWYKDTWGPYQHFAANALRAIENRQWVIRSGNTGISAVIDPWGRVVARLPLNVRGRLDADVPLDDPFPVRSFYSRHGDWLGLGCLVLTVLAGAGAVRKKSVA